MKFRSPTDDIVCIALTTGDTCVIGVEYTEIDPMFNREAIARGCLPEGVEIPKAKAPDAAFDRKAVITDAINDMLDGGVEGDFTKDGKPNLDALCARIGFTIDRKERDAVWNEIAK